METDFVAWLLGRLPADDRLEVGPGDDAAVLRPPAQRRTVVTVDMLMEGVDFVLGPDCPPQAVGHKALAVSLSDLAAMGAKPEAAVAAVALPRHGGDAVGRGLLEGMIALAVEHGVSLAGGDTNAWDGPLVISTTAIGSVPPGQAWRRGGGRVGDVLLVTGRCGGSLLGRHLAVTPRCREAAYIAEHFRVHAAMDVSDGLSLDLSRMMQAGGTAAVLDLDAVPIHPDAVRMSRIAGDGRSPLEHALGDGEDFELLLAMAPADAQALVAAASTWACGTPVTVIGEIVAGEGLFHRGPDGQPVRLEPRGFIHDFDG